MGEGATEISGWEWGPNGSKRSTWVEMGQTGGCGKGSSRERRRNRSEKTDRKGDGRKNTPIMCQRLNCSCPPGPHAALPDTPLLSPHPALHSPLLQELEGSREASKRGSSKRVMVWCRVGQSRARRLLPPGSPKPVYSTLGVGMRGAPQGGEGRKRAAGQRQKEPAAHASP